MQRRPLVLAALALPLPAAWAHHGWSGFDQDRPTSALVRRQRRDLVEGAKLMLNERYQTPPSLTALARALGCSPFHLSRTFHRTVGLSLRRYVGRLRTRWAADRLAKGAGDLTELALGLGYADHSHFTNAFRREWGQPPSRFRRLLGTRPAD